MKVLSLLMMVLMTPVVFAYDVEDLERDWLNNFQPRHRGRVINPQNPQQTLPQNGSYPGNLNSGVFKNSLSQIASEIQYMIQTTDASDAELAKAQEYMMKAKGLLIQNLPPNACAVLFDGQYFTGMSTVVDSGPSNYIYNLSYYQFNDRTRSFKLRPGCKIGLWYNKNSDGGGHPVLYSQSSMDTITGIYAPLDGQATTVKCSCNPRDVF
jgi:hypothetical protein